MTSKHMGHNRSLSIDAAREDREEAFPFELMLYSGEETPAGVAGVE